MKRDITYKELKRDKTLNIITRVHDAKLDNHEHFIKYANNFFKVGKNHKNTAFRKLNRMKDAKLFNEEENLIKIDKAEKRGFFRLETFVDCYRRTIKISYCTLRSRIISKPLLLQYLIDNDFIVIYANDKRTMIVVNFEKRFEFIELILKAFLNDYQRGNIVK